MDYLKDKEKESIYDVKVEIDHGKFQALLLLFDDKFVACVQRSGEDAKVRRYSWRYTDIEGIVFGETLPSNPSYQLLVTIHKKDRSGHVFIRRLDMSFKSLEERKKFAFRLQTLSNLYKMSPSKRSLEKATGGDLSKKTVAASKVGNMVVSARISQDDSSPSKDESQPKSVAAPCFKIDPLISVENLRKLSVRPKTPARPSDNWAGTPPSSPGSRSTKTIIRDQKIQLSPERTPPAQMTSPTSTVLRNSQSASTPPTAPAKQSVVSSTTETKLSVPLELKTSENPITTVAGEVVISLKIKVDLNALLGTQETESLEDRLARVRKFITLETTNCELVFN